MKPPPDELIDILQIALAAVSLATWAAILRVWWRDGSVLPFETRRRVPWGPAGLLIAFLFIAEKIFALMTAAQAPKISAERAAVGLLQFAAFELFGMVIGIVLLRRVSGATRGDLGLPSTVGGEVEDAMLGVVTAVASLVPVYLVLAAFVVVFGPIPQHPLLERMVEDRNALFLAATVVSAAIVAPLFEEFIFRLLVQGWLEKLLLPPAAFAPGEPGKADDAGVPSRPADGQPVSEPSDSSDAEMGLIPVGGKASADPARAEMKTYWLPIVISSILFSAAHLGYGYSPVPLFLLGLILGYIYQRTHRILPCVVAHMTFNIISLGMAGLELFGRPAIAT